MGGVGGWGEAQGFCPAATVSSVFGIKRLALHLETQALLVIKCINFFMPQFPQLENRAINSIYFLGLP